MRSTQRLVTDRYVWPAINADVRRWTRACLTCQRAKLTRHTVTPIAPVPPLVHRFDSVHLDIVGPLPPSSGRTYLLTMIDRYTRWLEVIPTTDISAETIAEACIAHWISRFDVSSTVSTDRGAQFESRLFHSLCKVLGTKRVRTTAYHPAANGLVERFHRQLKASLQATVCPTHWVQRLPLVLLVCAQLSKATSTCLLPSLCMAHHFETLRNSLHLEQRRNQKISRPSLLTFRHS